MLNDFAASRRTEATRKGYPKMMRLLIADPDAFLTKAKADRRTAEDELISAIVRRRDEVSPATINGAVSTFKSFFDYEEIPFNWKRVRSVTPAGKTVAKDRAPTLEELRAALRLASPRDRTAILIMASGGLRIGALPGLKLKDVEYLKSGLAKITVYGGDPRDEYQTFVTPECVDSIRDYLASRERVGEKLTPDSLLFRDKFDYQGSKRAKRIDPATPHSTTEHNLRTTILRLWQRAGVRKVNDGRPFKSDHGLRKFAKTQFSRAGISWENGEVLLGHAYSYNKPSMDDLERQYLGAVPFLSVDEKYALKEELAVQEEDFRKKWSETRLDLLERDKEIREIKETQSAILSAIANGGKVDPEVLVKLLGFTKASEPLGKGV